MGGFSDSDIIVSVMESLCVKIGATEKLANSKEETIQEVMEECRMDFETAQLKVDRYWDVQK
mgnify:CR=1 FL=1